MEPMEEYNNKINLYKTLQRFNIANPNKNPFVSRFSIHFLSIKGYNC